MAKRPAKSKKKGSKAPPKTRAKPRKTPAMTAAQQKAGVYSVAGYLYQFLGTAVAITTTQPLPGHPTDPFVDGLLAFGIEAAAGGEDAVAVAPSTKMAVLFQYKYSVAGSAKEFRMADLKKIRASMEKAATTLRDRGYTTICGVLTSNRGAIELPDWVQPTSAAMPDLAQRTQALAAVTQGSHLPVFFHQADLLTLRAALENWLATYGVLPHEIAGVEQKIKGEFATLVGSDNQSPLSRASLLKTALGSESVLPLVGTKRHDRQIAQTKQWLRIELLNYDSGTGSSPPDTPPTVNRNNFQKELAAKVLRAPVVLVEGGGGLGKSVAVCQFLLARAERPGSPPSFLVRARAGEITSDWPRSDVSGELGAPLLQWTPIARLIERLESASGHSGEKPRLIVVIDGLDEHATWEQHTACLTLLKQVVDRHNNLANPTIDVCVIVTCRSIETFEDAFSTTGITLGPAPLERIGLSTFDDDEAAMACEQVSAEVRVELEKGGALSPVVGDEKAAQVVELSPAAQQFREDLRHPLIWGCFCRLGAAEQLGALAGEANCLIALAGKVVGWLLVKIRRRQTTYDSGVRADVLQCLGKMATSEWGMTKPATRKELHACAEPRFADRFFTELKSAGLVHEVYADTWQWRYGFVAANLHAAVNLHQGGGL